jgi:hypothetical protein
VREPGYVAQALYVVAHNAERAEEARLWSADVKLKDKFEI